MRCVNLQGTIYLFLFDFYMCKGQKPLASYPAGGLFISP